MSRKITYAQEFKKVKLTFGFTQDMKPLLLAESPVIASSIHPTPSNPHFIAHYSILVISFPGFYQILKISFFITLEQPFESMGMIGEVMCHFILLFMKLLSVEALWFWNKQTHVFAPGSIL